MTDIVEFLKARLDEDERAAMVAIDSERYFPKGEFDMEYEWSRLTRHRDNGARSSMSIPGAVSPTRALREVAAKRKIVETYREAREHPDYLTDPVLHAMVKQHKQFALVPLTEVYREHPDFGRWRS